MKPLQTTALRSIDPKSGTRLLLLSIMLFSAGCTALPEKQIGSVEIIKTRQQAQADHKKEFIAYRRQCYAWGRRLFIDAKHKLGHDGIPHRLDRYTCV